MVDMPPIMVPLSDGTDKAMMQILPGKSKKTLVIWTNPAVSCCKNLEVLANSLQEWTDCLSLGKIPAK